MRTANLNLMMQKSSQVVKMIIAHKSFHIIYIFKRLDKKNKGCVGSGTQYILHFCPIRKMCQFVRHCFKANRVNFDNLQ